MKLNSFQLEAICDDKKIIFDDVEWKTHERSAKGFTLSLTKKSGNLFLELKNYSFFFDDTRFDIDIVSSMKEKSPYELYMDKGSVYILVPMPSAPEDMLKVYYPKADFMEQIHTMRTHILYQFLFLTLLAFIISMVFSFYALSPLRRSLTLLETFIKDIIHDLNTPISNILINLKMMDAKNEEVESISRSTKAISMLHNNLNAYLEKTKNESEKFKLKEVIDEQVTFLLPCMTIFNGKLKWMNVF